MRMNYTQLSQSERYQVSALLRSGHSKTSIAQPILAHINCYLRLALSPQQVCGRLLREGIAAPSVETIYQHIVRDQAASGDLYTYLRCQKVRRKR